MPGPDPHDLWIEDGPNGPIVTYQAYPWTGNHGNRRKRAISILMRLSRGDWRCRHCWKELPA